MVEIMENTWRGMLAAPPSNDCTTLPSPEDLRGKILVKVKAAPKESPVSMVERPLPERQSSISSSSSSAAETKSGPMSPKSPKSRKNKDSKHKKSKIIESLSSLGIYTRSYHFKNLGAPEATIPTHVFSLSEKKLMELHETSGSTLFSHNKDYLMRAYPSGTRVSSSNLDPAVFWRKGVQMVALNWQKFDAVRE